VKIELCFIIVKVMLVVPLLCICALLGKAVPEITYTVSLSGGMLDSAHSLTHSLIQLIDCLNNRLAC